ncbi:hypothetical protein NDU88_004926 [Pleurodeles waltl]|uniref:Uncharacterized protein n=1 Tax=Pleurodeles waltl TaxID=8319 RepID=A0AAV7RLV5_PLEWA|nr:hypothetical protein NDU88_004926 [Pleurodeles waltl]
MDPSSKLCPWIRNKMRQVDVDLSSVAENVRDKQRKMKVRYDERWKVKKPTFEGPSRGGTQRLAPPSREPGAARVARPTISFESFLFLGVFCLNFFVSSPLLPGGTFLPRHRAAPLLTCRAGTRAGAPAPISAVRVALSGAHTPLALGTPPVGRPPQSRRPEPAAASVSVPRTRPTAQINLRSPLLSVARLSLFPDLRVPARRGPGWRESFFDGRCCSVTPAHRGPRLGRSSGSSRAAHGFPISGRPHQRASAQLRARRGAPVSAAILVLCRSC